MEATAATIYTIGHSNVPDVKLVELLRAHAIAVIVDVRSAPYSQYTPHFNREIFAATLAEAGIEYRFAGTYLGGRPQEGIYYKNGEVPAGDANYLELVNYRKAGPEPMVSKRAGSSRGHRPRATDRDHVQRKKTRLTATATTSSPRR